MKKTVSLIALSLLSLIANAEDKISVGLGIPYGGLLGGKYTVDYEKFKIYAGAGLLGATSYSGSALGYNLGFEYQIKSTNSSLGLSYGTVSLSTINLENKAYIGPSINYSYYFSGFNNASWLIGLSAFQGKRDTPDHLYENKDNGLFIILGFQF